MKIFSVFFLLFLMCLSTQMQAQYNQYGRRSQRGERGYVPPPKPVAVKEVTKPEIDEYTDERATLYTDKFGFDAFQKEVLKKFLKNYYIQKHEIEFNPALKFEDKLTLINDQQIAFQKELETFLTPEQVSNIMAEEQYGEKSKKSKKDKKKKKKGKKSQ